ncbi:MAG: VOC family protein [Chloroflexi bacterium]|nr:VOC family protein [Chloroflexota bacterium]
MITGIEKVTVYVNSQEEAKKFWTEKMGFILTFEQEMAPGLKWMEVAPRKDCPTSLVLYSKESMRREHPELVAHPSVMFAATDIENLWKTLKSKGVEVSEIQSLPYGKMFNFKDNDGNPYLIRG